MPQLDFYNLNANRVYPLVDQDHSLSSEVLPKSLILDCGFFLTSAREAVLLQQIVVASPEITLRFGTASGLIFEFTVTAPGFSQTSENGGVAYGRAFVVLGELPSWADGTYTADADIEVEPARIQNAGAAGVRKVSLASQLPATPTEEAFCEDEDYTEAQQYVITGEDLIGDLKIKAGYNAALNQNATDNSITIQASAGAGDGQPCGEITLPEAPAEFTPPTGTQLGGVSCAEVIQAINGVQPTEDGEITLTGGNGITVEAVPDDHKIIITFLTGAETPFCPG
jgi:hypothetical protein